MFTLPFVFLNLYIVVPRRRLRMAKWMWHEELCCAWGLVLAGGDSPRTTCSCTVLLPLARFPQRISSFPTRLKCVCSTQSPPWRLPIAFVFFIGSCWVIFQLNHRSFWWVLWNHEIVCGDERPLAQCFPPHSKIRDFWELLSVTFS